MAASMADRVAAGRRRSFVGRTAELDQFRSLLDAPEPAVVFLHGPAGVGKSTLLQQLADLAGAAGCGCVRVDTRDLPPVLEAVAQAWIPALTDPPGRVVVLMDTYELLAELDDEIRERLAGRLPGDAILVIAGQQPPSSGWRLDPGWAPLVRSVRLGNLSADESARYLRDRAVPDPLVAGAVRFTHGHPLALALVGEVIRERGDFAPTDTVSVVQALVERLVAAVPERRHRLALEAAALVRVVDEELLAAMLDIPDAAEVFGWLRRLPVADPGPLGLRLHDLARDVLAADVRWRHPQRFALLHDRARSVYLSRLETAGPMGAAQVLLDLIFLHPDLRPFLQPPADGSLAFSGLGPGDAPAVAEIVRRHEGEASADLAQAWLAARPAAWSLLRRPDGEIAGFLCLLDVSQDAGVPDPAVEGVRRGLAAHPPARPGERITLIRYWMSTADYQSVSGVQSLIATQLARHYLTTPGLAVSFLPFADPLPWQDFCTYADQNRRPEADFAVGGRSYAVYDHDWRVVPPAAWVARLSQQEVGRPPAPREAGPAPAVLSEEDFAAAVRRALKDFTRPDRLRTSALLQSRLVPADIGVREQVSALQSRIRSAAETLNGHPGDQRLFRVLVRAYLSPAPTLEKAAEVLDLPSSTFRRLLFNAVARVTALLWYEESQGS